MSQSSSGANGSDDSRAPGDRSPKASGPSIDPWSIVSYLLSGMLIWGGAGWLLDRWLGTSFLVLIGLLTGTALSLYLIYLRLGSS